MAFLYELAILGSPTSAQLNELKEKIVATLKAFEMELGVEVNWVEPPNIFQPQQRNVAAAVFFGAQNAPEGNLADLLQKGIPILPVVSDVNQTQQEIPEMLRRFNCLSYAEGGIQRIATALLECVGLLPKQRRVFLSYRRKEASEAALQLFDELSAKHFDVFIDTHGIAPAEDFQATLWHRLCDSDVLIMLDTATYFESRWTNAEFGRALAKNIAILRIGWPDTTPSRRTGTVSRCELIQDDIDSATGRLTDEAITRICTQLEEVRSFSHAVRNLNMISNLKNAIEKIGGTFVGLGLSKSVNIKLPDSREVVVYPTLGVPTSMTLHDATRNTSQNKIAVLYDHIGLRGDWLEHLDWLGSHVLPARWVKAEEASWRFADWE